MKPELNEPQPQTPPERDERTAAARVIVAVNERLGTQTEQWIIDLASEDRDRVPRDA